MEAPSPNTEQEPPCSRRSSPPKHATKRTKLAPVVPTKPSKKSKNNAAGDVSDGVPLSVPRQALLQCQDLTKLPLLYPQTVLECVRERCLNAEYYSWAGPTLVAVNPCHSVSGLYKEAEVLHYHQALQAGVSPLRPHVYAVAGTAHHRRWCGLGRTNQAVVVSGESGAGKTESARYMLSYLCQVEDFSNGGLSADCAHTANQTLRRPVNLPADSSDSEFETSHGLDALVARTQAKVLASNPLLEAFGNAATLRNHNSSRFGKLLRLQYGGNELRGAVVDTYLLEKTRVTHQPQGERNFHILHQVVAGIQAGVLNEDGCRLEPSLPDPPTVPPPPFTITPLTTNDDVRGLHCTLSALDKLSFSIAHQNNLLRVLVALLHLGNVQFEMHPNATQGCGVTESSLNNLTRASDLLGVTCDQLNEALTVRTIAVPTKDRVSVFRHKCERPVECYERRSACMQLLYHGLFAHLILTVNEQIAAKPRHAWAHFIGILDVYGFEAFEHNSLEQLCINYANERLQQAFIESFLRIEQQVLLEEGVVVDESNFKDNSGCLTALHSPVSVFAILNEECQLQRAVDEVAACERVCRALQHSEFVYSPTTSKSKTASGPSYKAGGSQRLLAPSPAGFVVRHYAGPVHYSPVSLLIKNKDLVPGEVVTLLGQSEDAFVAGLLDQDACRSAMGTPAPKQEKMTSRWNSSPSLSSPSLSSTASPPECSSSTQYNTGSLRRPSTPTQPHNTASSNTGSMRRGARKVTTLSKFKSSLDALLATLASCDLHYVRCVKPNRQAVAGTTNDQYLMSQLSACGILDTVAVCRAGYPVRMMFEEFCERYGERAATVKDLQQAEHILKQTVSTDGPDKADLFSVGKRRVFLSEAAFRTLEGVRERNRAAAACIIQTNWRRILCMRAYRSLRSAAATVVRCAAVWRARRNFLQTRRAAITIQRYVRGYNARLHYCTIKNSSVIIQKTVKMCIARRRFLKLRRNVVILQSHARRLLTQRSIQAIKTTRVTAVASRSPSAYSITSSANSFGYQTGSVSLYSLESAASHTPSPDHAFTNMADTITSNISQPTSRLSQDRLLPFPPATRRSVLETEESGIETDTESMSGDRETTDGDDQARARVRKRRATLRNMQPRRSVPIEERRRSSTGTDGHWSPVLVRTRHNPHGRPSSTRPNQNVTSSVPTPNVAQSSQSRVEPFGPNSNDVPSSVTVRRRKRKSKPTTSDPNLVKINSPQQLRTVLGMFTTKPETQFVYSSDETDFYFKDGIISKRRIPPVPVRFHTRATCLPFSHHRPRALQPQGLVDAFQ